MKTLRTFNFAAPCALLFVGCILSPKASALTFNNGQYTVKVETSPGSGNYQPIGTIYEFNTERSLEDFYNYEDFKYNGEPLNFQPDQAHLFMVRSSLTDEVGLFSVNGSPDETATSLIKIMYQIQGGEFDRIAVSDDSLVGQYTEVTFPNPNDQTLVQGLHGWDQGFNDGAVLPINDYDGDEQWKVKIDVVDLFSQFEDPQYDDLWQFPPFKAVEEMVFLSADSNGNNNITEGENLMIREDLQNGTSFLICPDDTDITVPEPSNVKGLILLGILGGGLAFLQKRK